MQFTISFVALALASLAVATPFDRRQAAGAPATAPGSTTSITASQCDVGNAQCCQTTQTPAVASTANLLGPLGVALQGLTGLVGATCTPLVGVAGTSCTAQPVCCSNNSFNGVIALGCTPINLNV